MMLTVLLLNVIGHEQVSDVDTLEADRSLCRLVRGYEPELECADMAQQLSSV